MFETLTDRMSHALRRLRGLAKLTPENTAEALAEVRTALLAADVHFKVAREFVERVQQQCAGQDVIQSVSPGQQVVKVINDELVRLLGEGAAEFSTARPLRILLVGLQGSGKTTSAAKLGKLLRKRGYTPLLVACDAQRPAAIDQLETLAKAESLAFFADRTTKDVPKIAREALAHVAAIKTGAPDALIFDTAGRLQIAEDLIEEIKRVSEVVQPHEILLVADAALGQEAVNVARAFHEALKLTGIVLTKLDGDARGGAALSMKSITGVPIKFAGIGEKTADFDVFHPDRMAQRILGMGDVVSLVEKAQENLDQAETERLAEKMKSADMNLEDFLAQMRQMKKLGSLGSVMKMMPGMGQFEVGDAEENKLKRTEAIILSMTPLERQKPQLLNGARRMRIAKGSGVEVRDVNQLLKQFEEMRKMLKMFKGGKGKRMMAEMSRKMGGMGGPGGMPFGR
ncbi:MAG TPA: signal recognition particle protein [Opitutales bacterium]|jgi:signal recognition particle subunit SRP54|nr:signal recognition particle protein [Opitutales bacterium]